MNLFRCYFFLSWWRKNVFLKTSKLCFPPLFIFYSACVSFSHIFTIFSLVYLHISIGKAAETPFTDTFCFYVLCCMKDIQYQPSLWKLLINCCYFVIGEVGSCLVTYHCKNETLLVVDVQRMMTAWVTLIDSRFINYLVISRQTSPDTQGPLCHT